MLRLPGIRTGVWRCLSSLVLVSACGQEPPPAPSLDELLAQGRYEAVVDESRAQLRAAYGRGALEPECWAIERPLFVALARLGHAPPLLDAWHDAQIRGFEAPEGFISELTSELLDSDPTGHEAMRFLTGDIGRVETRDRVAVLVFLTSRFGGDGIAPGPYGPRGYPKAWLAPDERPADIPSERQR